MIKNYVGIDKILLTRLISDKFITSQQANYAIKIQFDTKDSLGDILVSLNYIKRSELLKSASETLKIPFIDLNRNLIDQDVLMLIPESIVSRNKVVPVLKVANTLTVAMADPFNLYVLDELSFITGMDIEPLFCNDEDLQAVMNLYFTLKDNLR